MKASNKWLVVYVKYKHEEKVNEECKKIGIESYLPMITSIRNWSDRKKTIQVPLFPSYIFVKIKSKLDFHKVASLDSTSSFVRFGNEYGSVSEKEINHIKLLLGRKDITEIQSNVRLPKIGEKLKIEFGSLSGLDCEVCRVDNIHKISVWIKSLRQNILATVPAYYLQKNTTKFAYH